MASIVRMGVGYDRLDRVALAERGVTVCNVPGTLAMVCLVVPLHFHLYTPTEILRTGIGPTDRSADLMRSDVQTTAPLRSQITL